MLLICPSCNVKNFLDPYPFWNFKGTTKCAGCGKVWRIETSNGACVSGPDAASGSPDLLPGFAEKQDYSGISGEGLTRPAPRARPDSVCRPIPMKKNIKGTPLMGFPLKKDELVGSKAKYMVAGAK